MKTLLPFSMACFAIVCSCQPSHTDKKQNQHSDIMRNAYGDLYQVPPFNAMAQNGQTLSSEALKGMVYTVNFFFTSCPDVCPEMNEKLKYIQSDFINNPDFKLLSFTIDPDFDTLDVLRKYAVKMGAKAGKWFFLRSSKDSVTQLARKGFLLPLEQLAGKDVYIHSSRIVLVSRDGIIFNYYDSFDELDMKRLQKDIKYLLSL